MPNNLIYSVRSCRSSSVACTINLNDNAALDDAQPRLVNGWTAALNKRHCKPAKTHANRKVRSKPSISASHSAAATKETSLYLPPSFPPNFLFGDASVPDSILSDFGARPKTAGQPTSQRVPLHATPHAAPSRPMTAQRYQIADQLTAHTRRYAHSTIHVAADIKTAVSTAVHTLDADTLLAVCTPQLQIVCDSVDALARDVGRTCGDHETILRRIHDDHKDMTEQLMHFLTLHRQTYARTDTFDLTSATIKQEANDDEHDETKTNTTETAPAASPLDWKTIRTRHKENVYRGEERRMHQLFDDGIRILNKMYQQMVRRTQYRHAAVLHDLVLTTRMFVFSTTNSLPPPQIRLLLSHVSPAH